MSSTNHQYSTKSKEFQEAESHPNGLDPTTIDEAIVQTVAYVDMYDFPLTAAEIHRYLIGVLATMDKVEHALKTSNLVSSHLDSDGEYYFLNGRDTIVETRRKRAGASGELWPHALYYGQMMSGLPYVRMVAVTGSLAVDNIDSQADIDFLVVTEVGRLWLCRAMVVLLVRWAAQRGIHLCPNYFLSERALNFEDRNLYTAHEIAQMIPLSGLSTYRQMRTINGWVADFLPNSTSAPRSITFPAYTLPAPIKRVRSVGELMLRTAPGNWVEKWEMERKIRKFSEHPAKDAAFSADYCKGHFDDHGKRTMGEYTSRLNDLGLKTLEDPSE